MKIALKDGQVLIKEADENQFLIIKSWGKMKWSKGQQMLYGPADIELLNKLSGLVRLPGPIEERRKNLNEVAAAIDRERFINTRLKSSFTSTRHAAQIWRLWPSD